MGVELDLYVADESMDSPCLSGAFLEEILWERDFKFSDFLSPEEEQLIKPNMYGEIVFGKKRAATFLEKAKMPFILSKAMKGKITEEEINKLRDKLVDRSEKIEDRERDPVLLKQALTKLEAFLIRDAIDKAEQFKDDFQKCFSFLDKAISSNKKVLWEWDC